MVKNLDLIDRKILYELDINARQPLTVLSKKIGKSRNTLEYRIKKLQERGIIKNFVTLLDAGKLGLMIWNVYLEFQNLSPTSEKQILNYLHKDNRVWWVAQTTGNWSLIYSIMVKDIKDFYNTVKEFNTKFGNYVLNQSLAAHVEVEIFSRGYFLNKPSVGVKWYKKFEPVKLDEMDKRILKEISINARIPSVELATKIKSTARVAAYRIKELQRKGVITRFRLQSDVSKIGLGFYKILVHLKNLSEENDKLLEEYCRKLGNVMHFERKIGPWMLELELDSESLEKTNELMKKMKEQFSNYIKSYEIMLIYNEPKGELDLTQQL